MPASLPEPPPLIDDLPYTVAVAPDKAGLRLDRLLADALPALSRARVRLLIVGGHVHSSEGEAMFAPDHRVRAGECFVVRVPEIPPFVTTAPAAQAMPLAIVYEDVHLIVLDKPAGLVVHPGAGNADGTLVNALLAHCPGQLSSIGSPLRPGIVHRLDKDTSGLLVVAKSDLAHLDLARQFARHSVKRAYWAFVWGGPVPPEGRIDYPIGRSPQVPTKMAAVARGGKVAETRYRTLKRYGTLASLLECRLATGRTHQIRVHMASIGYPLIGDRVYGGVARLPAGCPQDVRDAAESLAGQALHAFELGFIHPATGDEFSFTSTLPMHIKRLVTVLETH
ncbi:Ribosomal large subunit pseudouridine synthase D [Candidatus Defluviicoccus seviourii]|uniref:Pseudouridine synthase n=1 Tax=Candidatus Defluviicoccus seviourii TaxID=2565273 RepID=A0A564WCP0_9PROT|nr:Ribosomal large subunit pseudouridine synthase D [Candidatus Defluviicoccus seviourii]